MPRDGLSGAGHAHRPWQRRTRQRPRYGLDFRVRAARRVVQLMRLTLFLVVDSAAGMSFRNWGLSGICADCREICGRDLVTPRLSAATAAAAILITAHLS